jgi:hypothetical protein
MVMPDKKMGIENLVSVPIRSLPLTGVSVAGIRKYAELPCRATTERDLLNFINSCLNAEKIYGCVIKAWWGEGKTDAYENFIKPQLEEKKILTFDVVATTIARVFEKRQKEGVSDPVIWVAFLASLFEAIWEEKKSRHEAKIFERSIDEIKSDFAYIKRVIQQLMEKSSKIFFFIDEMEQLERLPVREDILLGIRGLFDQKEEILRGNLHLILACTPDAFNRLVGSSAQMGGLLERLMIMELPRPSKEEAVKFVYGLINYMYEGKVPDPHPFLNSGVAYAIVYAGHSSPRGMIKALQQVIEHAKHQAKEAGYEGYLKKIDGWMVIDALKNYNIPIFGSQVTALDGDFLDNRVLRILNIKGEPDKTNLLRKLIYLLIGEPIPILLSELCVRLNAPEQKIKECIGIANNRVEESKILNGLLILQLSKSSEPEENIPEDLRYYFLTYLISDNSNDLKPFLFIPLKDRALKSLFPELDLGTSQKILRKISRYVNGESYYLISPELIEHVYPNPEFLELEFIKDKNRRLELWKNAYEIISEKSSLSLCEETLIDLIRNLSSVVE